MDRTSAFHWSLVESPLGIAGVVATSEGRVRRVVLPSATRKEATQQIMKALSAIAQGRIACAVRPEEACDSPGIAPEDVGFDWRAGENAPGVRDVAAQISEYLAGNRRCFEVTLDLSGVGGFTRSALKAAAQIPYGQTRSYWWVAVRAGNPRAARAVGHAMATNPIPLIVPCHRVVRSDGSLGGFGGGGPEQKSALLALEGWRPGALPEPA